MCETCRRYSASTASPWHGRHSLKELRAACAELGIKRPVVVKAAMLGSRHPGDEGDGERWDRKNFGVWLMPDAAGRGPAHEIHVRWDLPHDVANESILHELTHARQFEEVGSAEQSQMLYAMGDMLFGYKENPLEEEARDTAARLRERFSIARPGR